MIASLPMYDLPELRSATDRLWREIRALLELERAPLELSRDRSPEEIWNDPALLFAQTCGYPLTHGLTGKVCVIAAPRYSARGCRGASYSSLVVVPSSASVTGLRDLRGKICAVNQTSSHSGMNALRAEIAPLSGGGRFFGSVKITGSHAASLELVAQGAADVAAIDCVTYALLERCRPHVVARTRVIAEIGAAPALPFITRHAELVAPLRAALECLSAEARAPLLLEGFEPVTEAAYRVILELEERAVRLGYPEIA
jgi:ABC-type phosphate/phosphonate transport system substrate-binding protein